MKKSVILFLLIPVFLSPTLSVYGENEPNDKQIDDLVESTHRLLEQGKHTEALEVVDVLIANFSEDLDMFEKIFDTKPLTNSKYQGYAQIEIRNSDGWLVGFIETSKITYTPITADAFLDLYEIVEMVENNGKTFEKRIIVDKTLQEKTHFLGLLSFSMLSENYKTAPFSFLPAGLVVESGDTIIATLTILKEVT